MTGWEFVYIAGAIFMCVAWLIYGVLAGNTDTGREKLWLIGSAGLMGLFWPLVVIIGIIGAALDTD